MLCVNNSKLSKFKLAWQILRHRGERCSVTFPIYIFPSNQGLDRLSVNHKFKALTSRLRLPAKKNKRVKNHLHTHHTHLQVREIFVENNEKTTKYVCNHNDTAALGYPTGLQDCNSLNKLFFLFLIYLCLQSNANRTTDECQIPLGGCWVFLIEIEIAMKQHEYQTDGSVYFSAAIPAVTEIYLK